MNKIDHQWHWESLKPFVNIKNHTVKSANVLSYLEAVNIHFGSGSSKCRALDCDLFFSGYLAVPITKESLLVGVKHEEFIYRILKQLNEKPASLVIS